jgi:hypothetical protein
MKRIWMYEKKERKKEKSIFATVIKHKDKHQRLKKRLKMYATKLLYNKI